MKIAVVGTGYVGLVLGACLAENGNTVVCVDKDTSKVDMLEAGLFKALFDVQCFDLRAVDSYRRNAAHMAMSASLYANPHNRGAVVNQLHAMIIGATEIDLDFNVNVTTGTDGMIIGGSWNPGIAPIFRHAG